MGLNFGPCPVCTDDIRSPYQFKDSEGKWHIAHKHCCGELKRMVETKISERKGKSDFVAVAKWKGTVKTERVEAVRLSNKEVSKIVREHLESKGNIVKSVYRHQGGYVIDVVISEEQEVGNGNDV